MRVRAIITGMLATLVAGSPAAAQNVRGMVRDSASGAPIAGVVVVLRDGAGASLARGLTSPGGRYSVAAPSAAARLQVTRIGYRPREASIPAPENGVSVVDVALARLPTMLEPVRTTAAGRCPARADGEAAFALLDQARAGLLTATVGRETDSATVTLLTFDRTMDGNSDRIDHQRVRTVSVERAKTSFNAARPAADLVERGFVQGDVEKRAFFGPDADVMLDERFARQYCFRIVSAAAADTARVDQVGLGFAPLDRRRGRVDIEGTLWVDTVARRLGGIEFHYAGLDNVTSGFGPGGRVSFREVAPGTVLIDRWALRIVGAADTAISGGGETRVGRGYAVHEVGGELADVRWPDGRTWTAALGRVRIRATANGQPAPNVFVTLDSTDYHATTDSSGAAEISSLVPGPYSVAVADAPLAELGISVLTPVSFTATRDSAVAVDVRASTAEEHGGTLCRADGRVNTTTWILGRVMSADGQPLGGVRWKLSRLNAGTWRPFADGGVTGTSGMFRFCTSLPAGTSIQLLAWRDGQPAVPEVVLRTVTGPVVTFPARLHGVVAAAGPAGARATPSVLRGAVVDSASGGAVAGAHVWLLGTSPPMRAVTDSGGRFQISGVPPGEYAAQVRTWSLDSLGAVSQSTIVFADSTTPVRLRLPAAAEIASSLCSAAPGTPSAVDRGLVVGTVDALGDSAPPENAIVVALWKEPSGQEHWLHARTGARGAFRLCGVPLNTTVAMHAATTSGGSGPVDVRVPSSARFTRVELTLDQKVDERALLGRVGLQAGEQRRELVGFVRDPQGAGIENVTVEIPNATTRTDASGAFRVSTSDVDTLPVLVRHIGFTPVSAILAAHEHQWDTLVVELGPAPRVLAGVKIEAPRGRSMTYRGIAERQAQGLGVFLTRQEIEARSTSRLSDLLRSKRGILMVTKHGHAALRFSRFTARAGVSLGNLGGGFTLPQTTRVPGAPEKEPEGAVLPFDDCTPALWLDGVNMLDMEIDDLLAMDVEAIELYDSEAGLPAELTANAGRGRFCGAVVIWTRVSGSGL